MVMIRYAAANRDALVFKHADVFDIDRERSPQHLAFGVGPHFCVGAAVAGQELHSAFTQWLARTSTIVVRRTDSDPPVHEPLFILFPMKELPLRFEPA